MDTDFWVIQTTHGMYRVDEDTAMYVRQQVRAVDGVPDSANHEIEFKDMADSRIYIVVGTYLGIVESTAEQRRWDRKMNEALDEEKRQDGWSD